MSVIANLFSAAMYAFVLQNLIFTGGYEAEAAFPAHGVYHILFDIRQYFLRAA